MGETAYERLRRRQGFTGIPSPRYLVTPSTFVPPEAPSLPPGTVPGSPPAVPPSVPPVGTNTMIFPASKDGFVRRQSGPVANGGFISIPPPAPYPPAGEIESAETYGTPTRGNAAISVSKLYGNIISGARYWVEVGLTAYDTSALPDDAFVTGAVLRLNIFAANNDDNRALTFEWYEWSGAFGTDADWTGTVGTSAHTGVPLAGLPYDWALVEIPLSGAKENISLDGTTYLRGHISGGAPGTGAPGSQSRNDLGWAGRDYASWYPGLPDRASRLVVSYA